MYIEVRASGPMPLGLGESGVGRYWYWIGLASKVRLLFEGLTGWTGALPC